MATAKKPAAKKPASRKQARPTAAAAPAAIDGAALFRRQFAREYLRDLNATQAYLRARPGVTHRAAMQEGWTLLRHPEVVAEIAKVRAELEQAITYDVATMLRREAEIAFADPRELVEFVVECCRYCHGVDHRYQRTASELEQARREHALRVAEAKPQKRAALGDFDPEGGIGWDPRKAPHENCPECHGRGVGRTIVHDTRNLSPAAQALYAGVKQTKDGLQVLMQDQAVARDRLERHLGAFEKDNRQKNDLAAQIAEFVGGIHQSGAGRLQVKPRGPK
jgi:hypothetical protein